MKKFARKLYYLLLPLFLISYPLDLIFSSALKESHGCLGEYEVWNDIYNGKIDCDIAIYGSSRAWLQIDPEIIKDVLERDTYNFKLMSKLKKNQFFIISLLHLRINKYV